MMNGCPLEPHELGAVDIEFSFNNQKMLKKLVKRADLLKMGKFAEAEKIEQQLTTIKNKHFDDIVAPRSFYYTFKS